MSKAKKNAKYLEWLQEMRDQEDPDSNKYMILNKAFNSLKNETEEYPDPDSLIAVKFIGPKIVTDLKKRWKDDSRRATTQEPSPHLSSPRKHKKLRDAVSASDPKRSGTPSHMALQQFSSTVAGPSASWSHQAQLPSTSIANLAPREPNSLSEYSRPSNANQSAPHASSGDLNLSHINSPSLASTSVENIAASHPEFILKPPAATPIVLSSGLPAAITKQKPKGRVRGRVSEFAPLLPAVDELDVILEKEAARQRANNKKLTSSSVSHASADLIDSVTDLTTVAASSFPDFTPIVLPRGSFNICLVLDSREVKSQKHRDYIATELQKKGVNVLQRSLTLGDVLWIAQRKIPVPEAEGHECVLNYILERKRLDDLCLSIKDGRFSEQKFRLANTGLKVFYLIEEYNLERNRESFGDQIDTARSSTQVVDGFVVKETKTLNGTIDFLATMHQTIVEEHQNEPLYMIPPHLIKRHSYVALQKHLRISQPTTRYLTSYTCFENLNNKSRNLTTKDLFAQMLLCVKGVSAEKASTIVGTYPTMRSLWEAFRIAEVDEMEGARLEEEEIAAATGQGKKGKGRQKKQKVPQAKAMLCDLEGTGRQRIGPTLSANIYRLLRANSYEE